MSTSVKKVRKANPFGNRQAFIAHCKKENSAFLAENRRRVYIEYIRDQMYTLAPEFGLLADSKIYQEVKGPPHAVFVAYKQDDGTLTMGWSAAHPPAYDADGYLVKKGDVFNKTIGLWKAIRRATGVARNTAKIPDRLIEADEWSQENSVSNFMGRAAAELDAKY